MCPASMQRAKAAVQVPTAVDKYLCTYRPAATLSSAGRVGGREGCTSQLLVAVSQPRPSPLRAAGTLPQAWAR